MFKSATFYKKWERWAYLAIELVTVLVLFLIIELVSEGMLSIGCRDVAALKWSLNTLVIFGMLALNLSVILTLLMLAMYKWTPPKNEWELRPIDSIKIFKLKTFYKSLAVTLLCLLIAIFLLNLIAGDHLSSVSMAQQTSVRNLMDSLPTKVETIVSSVIFAPIIEEIFFRYGVFWITNQGLVLTSNNWKSGIDTSPVVLFLSAAVANIFFAAIHSAFSFSGFLMYWAMGMGFSFMYIKYRNLFASITTHFVWNLCVISVILI